MLVKDGAVANFKIDLSNENDLDVNSKKLISSNIETFMFRKPRYSWGNKRFNTESKLKKKKDLEKTHEVVVCIQDLN